MPFLRNSPFLLIIADVYWEHFLSAFLVNAHYRSRFSDLVTVRTNETLILLAKSGPIDILFPHCIFDD